jgi:hypothetical protein
MPLVSLTLLAHCNLSWYSTSLGGSPASLKAATALSVLLVDRRQLKQQAENSSQLFGFIDQAWLAVYPPPDSIPYRFHGRKTRLTGSETVAVVAGSSSLRRRRCRIAA